MKAKTVVIGGGVMGVNIAMHAARKSDPLREPVVLLERGTLASGSSGRSGAILRTFYTDRVTAAMARDSLRRYANFQGRTGRSIGFTRSGVLTLSGTEAASESGAHVEMIRSNVAMMQSIGIDVRVVEHDEIRRLAPGIEASEGTIGAYEPGGGLVDPLAAVEAIAALARDYGATTRLGTPVTEIRIEGGRVLGVETPTGSIDAEQVVVSAGPWARTVLSRAGIDLPLRVVRPEQAFLSMPVRDVELDLAPLEAVPESDLSDTRFSSSGSDGPPPPHPILLDLELGYYSKVEPFKERTRIGRIDYSNDLELEDPDAIDEEVGDDFRRDARMALCRRMPMYRDEDELGAEAAWYTLTPDGQAMLGPVPGVEGLYVCAGFSGHGFKLAPSVGEGLSQMLAGQPVSAFDVDFFDPARFARDGALSTRRFGL